MGIASDITWIVVAGLGGALLATLLRQPVIIGYIAAGVLLNPAIVGPDISDPADIERLAELGVALLLFAIGLEFSLRELKAVRNVALFGTPIQLVLSGACGTLVGHLAGLGWQESIWLGAAVSLSSTMVTLRTLETQGRFGTLSSRVMIGVLIVQDLAVVPMMIVLPELDNPSEGIVSLTVAGGKAVVFLGAALLVGVRVLPRFMELVARLESRELFLLATAAIALGVGYVSHWAGLSYALGAFVAGLVLGESDYAHQALGEITPLRDLFGLVFFASVGLLVDPDYLTSHWDLILLVTLAVALAKGAIFAVITRAFGYVNVIPFAVPLMLFSVGEFAFVLAREGQASGSIDSDTYSLVLAVAIASMIVTPPVSGLADPLYRWWRRRSPAETLQTANVAGDGLRHHVVIAGGGRVGRDVATLLHGLDRGVVVIELDHHRFEDLKADGVPLVYGDAAHPAVLHAAGVQHARLVLVTVPNLASAEATIDAVRRVAPEVHVVARAEAKSAVRELQARGVYEAVQPHFEASLEMARQALLHLDVAPDDVQQVTDRARRELYAPAFLRDPAVDEVAKLEHATRLLDLSWLHVRERPGNLEDGEADLNVVAVVRDGRLQVAPSEDLAVTAGDVVAVVGPPAQIARLRRRLAGQPGG